MTFEVHVDSLCKKAHEQMYFYRKLCGFNVDSTFMRLFYSCPLPIYTARVGKRSKVLYLCALSLMCLQNLFFRVQSLDILTQQLQCF